MPRRFQIHIGTSMCSVIVRGRGRHKPTVGDRHQSLDKKVSVILSQAVRFLVLGPRGDDPMKLG